MGPKRSITVQVKNGPSDYYLALLQCPKGTTGSESELFLDPVDDSSVQAYLKDFYHEGWVYHVSPVGPNYYKSDSEHRYNFGYMVPDIVRVILISSDGTVYLSDRLDVEEFNAKITYDVAAGTLDEQPDTYKPLRRAILMITCLVLTLALELLILKLFRYPFTKHNIICFTIINVITNIPFTFLLLFGLFDRASLPLVVIMFFMEIIITIVESVFYLFTLRSRSGEKRKFKNFLYGIVSNVFSAVMGDVIIFVFWMIMEMDIMRAVSWE
ncbi:MAG: hypothetical protein IKN57_06690 [Parasporobacterium sp.]|nr:hypothetical protein [Parasporobacterium sp.]